MRVAPHRVIASREAAKQSREQRSIISGLLRRFAARNDGCGNSQFLPVIRNFTNEYIEILREFVSEL
jgi:hypothetical protein